MRVPEKLINFRIYNDGTDLLGTADVELPDLDWMTEDITGAGVAGKVESPVIGHFDSMVLKINWRTVTENSLTLTQSKIHSLDARGSIQHFDVSSGEYETKALKIVAKVMPKKVGLGKLEPAKMQGNTNEFEVIYLKVFLAGAEKIEIDKYNFIAIVDGVDYLASVRGDLGL